MSDRWFHLPINPEPWAIGPLTIGRRNGKVFPAVGRNQQLHAFKEAVAAELEGEEFLPDGEYELHFYFWRNLAEYQTSKGRKAHRNVADATNLQKATEDALQGVLFKNDRDVKAVYSVVVETGPDVTGQILIRASEWYGFDPSSLPEIAWDMIDAVDNPTLFDTPDQGFTAAEDPF